MRTWRQRLFLAVNVLAILACLLGAAALGYTYSKVGDIGRVDLGGALASDGGGSDAPQNFLIVGTDSAEGLAPDDPVVLGRPGGVRSDTIMVLRLDPASTQASLLSLPRDLYVPIAGLRGSDRINSAIQGGPARLVDTITNDFGIPINHYVEINFLAFRKVVAAVDGVPVYFPNPVRDDHSGLDVPTPGCVTLDAEQALAFARARAYEEQVDGRWRTDPTGDLGRISRQQLFIRKVLDRAIDKGARNPAVADELLTAIVSAVHLDPTLTPADLLSIARRFASFDPQSLRTYSVPAATANVHGASVLRLDTAGAEPIFNIFRDVKGALSPNAPVTLLVNNGTGEPGGADRVANDLRGLGYTVPAGNVGDDQSFDHDHTVIVYGKDHEADARKLAGYLLSGADLVPTPLPYAGGDLIVVTGRDYTGVRPASTEDTTTTSPNTTSVPSTTAPTASGADTVTTTTAVGTVPVAPPDQSC